VGHTPKTREGRDTRPDILHSEPRKVKQKTGNHTRGFEHNRRKSRTEQKRKDRMKVAREDEDIPTSRVWK